MAKPESAPKVMDAVHPIGRRPSQTSRPVILSNREYMATDPMLSVTDNSGEDAVMPKSEDKKATELSGAPEFDAKAEATGPKPESVVADLKPVEEVQPEPLQAEADTAVVSQNSLSDAHVQAAEKLESTPSEPFTTPETAEAETDDDETPNPEPEATNEPLQAQQPLGPNEAALHAREEEIEHHIAAGTYAVPINTVKRRRAQITVGILVVLLIILIALDLLADMSIITLPFGLPHTNLLTS